MAKLPDLPALDNLELDDEMATALDEALDALQSGRAVDFQAILTRHPKLEVPLAALRDLLPVTSPIVAAPDQARPLPPSIGPYQVERELGAGGFGAVYLAYDPDVRRRVAVKVLHTPRGDQPDVLARFHREAQAYGRLCHPCIVQLYDYSRQGPPHYLITEYIAGVEPRAWCRERSAPPEEIAELVARVGDAIEYAHQQSVFHRDLKPGNVLIDAHGQPHILDFGLARLDATDGPTLTERTREGHVLGSLPYMSPEQASGQSHTADARSDVYSLGVILYELLTGRLPFQGPAHSLPAQVVEEAPPPPRQHNPKLSEDLEAICLKALAKRPQDRYASAAAFAADLRAYRARGPVTAPRRTWLGWVRGALDRRHFETLRKGWTLLLLLLGVTILTGCVLCNYWQVSLKGGRVWAAVLLTKAVQVAVMLWLAVRLRPADGASADRRPTMTTAERQIWSLVPGYYGAFLTLVIVNIFLEEPIPMGPVLAMLSGMGFWTLGATIWGWFKVWGLVFFLLALAMVFCGPYGLALLGAGWFVCLAFESVHLHWTR